MSIEEIESLFHDPGLVIRPDDARSRIEQRYLGIGRTQAGRAVFLAFTLRRRGARPLIRAISARFMHRKEIDHHEKADPPLPHR